MRQLKPAAFLASGILIFSGLFMSAFVISTPAFAEDEDETSSTTHEVEHEEDQEHSHQDKKHQEIEQKFGKQGRLAFPPIVIRPMQESSVGASFVAVNPALQSSEGAAVGKLKGTAVYPERNVPIDISKVKFTRKTPADVFIQAAQVGLYAMAGGALVLSAIAASRAIRRK
jgi:hypothetical protein